MIASLAVVAYTAGQELLDEQPNVAAASANNPYMMLGQHLARPFAHISGEHNVYAHTFEYGRYARLAATTLGRWQLGCREYSALVVCEENRIVVAVPEVVVYMSVACWYNYFHNTTFGYVWTNIRKIIQTKSETPEKRTSRLKIIAEAA